MPNRNIISRVYESIIHFLRYHTDREYREEEKLKNTPEWQEVHNNTLEGREWKLGLRRIIDTPLDDHYEMGRWVD